MTIKYKYGEDGSYFDPETKRTYYKDPQYQKAYDDEWNRLEKLYRTRQEEQRRIERENFQRVLAQADALTKSMQALGYRVPLPWEQKNRFDDGGETLTQRRYYQDGDYTGYTRDNGHPIAFDDEGNLTDQVTGEKGTMLTGIPDVEVIGKKKRIGIPMTSPSTLIPLPENIEPLKNLLPTPLIWQAMDILNKPLKNYGVPSYYFTNVDVPQDMLNYLDTVSENIAQKKYTNKYNNLINKGASFKMSINGKEYNKNYAGSTSTARNSFEKIFTTEGRAENTLGSFSVQMFPEGNLYWDDYDFQVSHLKNGGVYPLYRAVSNYTNSPDLRDYGYDNSYELSKVILYTTKKTGNPEQDAKNEAIMKQRSEDLITEFRESDKKGKEKAANPKQKTKRAEAQKAYNKARNAELIRQLKLTSGI